MLEGENGRRLSKVLSIAGSDPSGGAGIQGDIKTIFANSCYAMAAISALTAQNTLGVVRISQVEDDFFRDELEAIFQDDKPDSVKIGMIVSEKQVDILEEIIKKYQINNIVIDPLIKPTSGVKFSSDKVLLSLMGKLFPLASLVTPNFPEAKQIASLFKGKDFIDRLAKFKEIEQEEILAKEIGENFKTGVLVKGGHLSSQVSNDTLYFKGEIKNFTCQRIASKNNHGTGCAMSSAIACFLARGYDLDVAVFKAKEYITRILKSNLDIGRGNGPLDHGFGLI